MVPKKYWWFTDLSRSFFDRHPVLDFLTDLIASLLYCVAQVALGVLIYVRFYA